MAVHTKLDAKAATKKRLAKVLHDYPINLRRLQSTQEMIDELKNDPSFTRDEIKELENLEKHIQSEGAKKTRSDLPPKDQRPRRG